MKAFISYSHKDDWALDRLHTHLAMLRREGSIVEWYDREILAGGDIGREISEKLEECDLFLPLVSPDFLASDYCIKKEMTRALERHDASEVLVVPIIIEPCDWTASPLKKLKALPRDAKPVTEWTNQNNAFVDVVTALRRVLTEDEDRTAGKNVVDTATSFGRAGEEPRYRVKRDFDEIDRSDFRNEAFAAIRNYFLDAVAEIDSVEGLRGRFVSIGPQSFSCTVVNRAMDRGTAHITVHARTGNASFGDIYYSFSENASENTANGGFSIECDEYDLFLKNNMFASAERDERLTAQGAAELLWTEFLEKAGVTHD